MKPDDLGNIIEEVTVVFKSVKDRTKKYRYFLERSWDINKPIATLILHNPSIADHQINDPTVTSCMNNLITKGYGSLIVVNLNAYIDTKNNTLYEQKDYIGQDNDEYIYRAIESADVIILGWGEWNGIKNKKKKKRAIRILKHLEPYENKLFCYGVNQDKSPKHPLNIKITDTLIPYKLT